MTESLTSPLQEAVSRRRYMAATREQARAAGEEATQQRAQTPWWRPAQWWTARQAQKDAELQFDAAEAEVRKADTEVKALQEHQDVEDASISGAAHPTWDDLVARQETEHARVAAASSAALDEANKHLMAAGRGHAPWDRTAATEREQEFLRARWADARGRQLTARQHELGRDLERMRQQEQERPVGHEHTVRERDEIEF